MKRDTLTISKEILTLIPHYSDKEKALELLVELKRLDLTIMPDKLRRKTSKEEE